jgi:TPR repeat protein
MALMIEVGFDDRPGDADTALEYYERAAKLLNTDAIINLALYCLNGVGGRDRDMNTGRMYLKKAFRHGNERAVEYMINYGFIKNRKEMEAEMLNYDDEQIF